MDLITLVFIMLGWIPFRANSLKDTFTMWGHLIDIERWNFLGLRENTYLYTFILFIAVIFAKKLDNFLKLIDKSRNLYSKLVEIFVWLIIFAFSLIYLEQSTQFIYFQF